LLAAPVIATKCGAGHKHKDDLTSKFCSTSATDAGSCDSSCCEKDTKTCGGLTVVCPFGTYAVGDDAWKNKETTEKTKLADCCQPSVTCDNTLYTCPAGFKKTTSQVNKKTKCPAGPKSCATKGVCCEADVNTCGGYQDKHGGVAGTKGECTPVTGVFKSVDFADTDAPWRSMKLSGATQALQKTAFAKECCDALPTCKSLTCKAGYKLSTDNADKPITGTINEYDADETKACCVEDSTKPTCGVQKKAISCLGGTYNPSSYDDVLVSDLTKVNTFCCVPAATCAHAQCPSGYKMKANVATLSCHGDHLACVTNGMCCEVDKTTCGGLALSTGISCPYGSYDESGTWVFSGDSKTSQVTMDAWNKLPATEATKNTACCTQAAQCKFEPLGTTTPAAAAVTTTPAVPI